MPAAIASPRTLRACNPPLPLKEEEGCTLSPQVVHCRNSGFVPPPPVPGGGTKAQNKPKLDTGALEPKCPRKGSTKWGLPLNE